MYLTSISYRRRATNARLNRKLDIWLDVQFHVLVGTGMVLTIVAVVNLMQGGSRSTNKALLDAGSALTCVAWVALALSVLLSVRKMRALSVHDATKTMKGGRMVSNQPNITDHRVVINDMVHEYSFSLASFQFCH